jgi:hypothetical protein
LNGHASSQSGSNIHQVLGCSGVALSARSARGGLEIKVGFDRVMAS